MMERANPLQLTAAGRRSCNRRASWPPSLGRWGRRKVVQMILHKFQLVVLGCLVVVIAGWIIPSPPGKGTGNDQRLSRMVRTESWGWRLCGEKIRLPGQEVGFFPSTRLEARIRERAREFMRVFWVW